MCRGHRKNRKRWDRVTIKATLYVWQMSDQDNLVARLKWPLDYLVKRRFILDDSPKVLEWVGMPDQKIDRKNQRVEIEINPIEGE
jgi:Holliday junction resolvase RusA-like endonuclease